MAKDIWRDYVIRKYVRARSAQEAIALSESAPVIEVNEMQDRPQPTGGDVSTMAVGFLIGAAEMTD